MQIKARPHPTHWGMGEEGSHPHLTELTVILVSNLDGTNVQQHAALFSPCRLGGRSPVPYAPRFSTAMQLQVRMLSGEEVASMPLMEVRDVRAVKQRLNQLHRLPTRFRQRIFFCGNRLDDATKLDMPMDLELVLLPYAPPSQMQVNELITASADGSMSKVGVPRSSES